MHNHILLNVQHDMHNVQRECIIVQIVHITHYKCVTYNVQIRTSYKLWNLEHHSKNGFIYPNYDLLHSN